MLSALRALVTSMPTAARHLRLMSVSAAGLISAVLMFASAAHAEYAYNFPKPVTAIAEDILTLHNTIMIICLVIFVVVFGFMFYSLVVHRKSRGFKPATFHDNVVVEILWTILPFVILIAMAIPSTAVLLKMDDTSHSELTVKITGYQWKWKYDYPDQDLSFFSNLSTPRAQIDRLTLKVPSPRTPCTLPVPL